MLSRMRAAAPRSCSTSVTTPAPRDLASSATAPLPAYRSRNASPATDPSSESIAEKSASRTRSEVGRVLAPAGALIRRPPAVPAMILVTARSPAFQELCLLGLGESAHLGSEHGVRGQCRVRLDETGGELARLGDDVLVVEHVQQSQAGPAARLGRTEHVTLAPLSQVDAGQLEAVGGRGDRLESFAGGVASGCACDE